MNEYCKEVLRHSWGTSPERKKLESEYNARYYSLNKNKWKVNKAKRQSGRINPTSYIVDVFTKRTQPEYGPPAPNAFDKAYSSSRESVTSSIKNGAKFVAKAFKTIFSSKRVDTINKITKETKEFLKKSFKETLRFFLS